MKENPEFDDFYDLVSWYFNNSGETTESISAKTGIPIRTVTSLRSKTAGDVKHNLNLLTALAVGLHMTDEHGNLLINLNGQFLREKKPIERHYKYILSIGSNYCVAACNDYLVKNGFAPLTNNNNISSYD